MSHAGHAMDMPTDAYLAKVYWMFVGGSITFASAIHIFERLQYRQRLSAASKATPDPARPRNPILCWYATATAITREATYYTAPLIPTLHKRYPRLATLPPFGRILLLAANLALLLSLAFYGFNVLNRRNWEAIGVRCGWITITQLPLVFLLAGKRNLVGYVTGTSYERLNWIHRWVARTMFLTASIHFGHFLRTWDQYDYIERKFELDLISRRGLGAWCILLWIVISSFAPVRGWRYEFFVIQHIISVIGFVVMIMLHAPGIAQHFVWLPVGFFFGDRFLRFCFLLYNNLGLFHGAPTKILQCRATLHPLSERATKVSIANPGFQWSPGQHALLTLPSLTGLQSHPFTIVSLPSDNTLDFIIRAQAGATQKLLSHATGALPPVSEVKKTAIVDGPYGHVREMEQFDTVVLLAGGTGASFIIPLLRDLVRRRRLGLATVTRRVKAVWVVKGRGQISWFAKELGDAVRDVEGMDGFGVEVSVYVTCDESLTAGSGTGAEKKPETAQTDAKVAAVSEAELCGGDVCCCQETLEDEDEISSASSPTKASTPCCCCGKQFASDTALDRTMSVAASLSLPETVGVVAGRPAVRTLIAKQLERATGETVVVVCGPPGLTDSVRVAVVGLSDERAVHKGTRAQGVYLHCEAFCI